VLHATSHYIAVHKVCTVHNKRVSQCPSESIGKADKQEAIKSPLGGVQTFETDSILVINLFG